MSRERESCQLRALAMLILHPGRHTNNSFSTVCIAGLVISQVAGVTALSGHTIHIASGKFAHADDRTSLQSVSLRLLQQLLSPILRMSTQTRNTNSGCCLAHRAREYTLLV
eukprot:scpid59339/ scgid11835/ 